MNITGQRYIYCAPGSEKLDSDILRFCEYYDTLVDERKVWTRCEGIDYGCAGEFIRYPVTEAEYRAHHGMLAWPGVCPDGYKVTDFREPLADELVWSQCGEVVDTDSLDFLFPHPILRKIECEHRSTRIHCDMNAWEKAYVSCNDCEMVRKLGDWEKSDEA